MGRFQTKGVIVRETGDLTIIFWNAKTIYVHRKGDKHNTVFNRWFPPPVPYEEHWKKFRRSLLEQKNLTLLKCYELAASHDILAIRSDREINFNGVKVIRRD